jgi:ribonuclease R
VSTPAATQLVAVLRRKGRFLVAEPLFEGPARDHGLPRRGDAPVVGAARQPARGRAGAGEGDLVLVGLSRRHGARVLRRLGRPDVARDVIEGLLLDRGLRRGFSATVEDEAAGAAARVGAAREERRDLTALATFTIDPVQARDFDDAISAQQAGDGVVRLWVHIADVAAHVSLGSAIDREARRRATSVYVPGTVEPMLPHVLSSDACSLREGAVRAAVTTEIELELETAKVRSAGFYRSLIRSDARLDYERVDRIFAGQERATEPWAAPLAAARTAAAALAARRDAEGALAIDSIEPEFEFNRHGAVSGIDTRVQTESHRLIESLMIAANEAVASLLSRRKVPCLYRVHERPDPARVERLVDQLASLEIPTPPVPERMSPSQASALLGEISLSVQRHLRATGGKGATALSSLILRSLKQAYYAPVNLGHAGLRSGAYCHFTSPIRRYPDLVCHRALLSAIGTDERAVRGEQLSELGVWTSEREREAMVIERDADDVAACFALEHRMRELGAEQVLEGEVVGLIGAGAFIAFDAPLPGAHRGARARLPFEGMLPVRLLRAPSKADDGEAELEGARRGGGQPGAARGRAGSRGRGRAAREPRQWWELNEQGTILYAEGSSATVRLGDALRVRVAKIEAVRGRVDLEPAG